MSLLICEANHRYDCSETFTFQYVSINMDDFNRRYRGLENLHSNMSLLILS